jgi:hypothetical protein
MHVCRVVLYTKTHPTVSHDDTNNISTKNCENLFVVLKAFDLKCAVYRPCIRGRSMPRPTHQRSLPSGIARHPPRWSSPIHPVERQRELTLTCLSSLCGRGSGLRAEDKRVGFLVLEHHHFHRDVMHRRAAQFARNLRSNSSSRYSCRTCG